MRNVLFIYLAIAVVAAIAYYFLAIQPGPEHQVADAPPRVYVSLTTSPKRINGIEKTIQAMTKQSMKPEKIILNLPRVFKRDNSTFPSPLPPFITNNPLIHVNFTEDIGPATKILPSLPLVSNPEDYILSIDDDIYYPPDFIRIYVSIAESLKPVDVVVSNSYYAPTEKELCSTTKECFPVRGFLEGFVGVLYRKRFLSDMDYTILKDKSKADACYRSDDLMLSNHIAKKNITIVGLNTEKYTEMMKTYEERANTRPLNGVGVYELGEHTDALHLQPGGHPYTQCMKLLKSRGELYLPDDELFFSSFKEVLSRKIFDLFKI
jgi:hypothetical protein